jgi:protein-S-isoprenylcysteine O-methyltransferase Ste14
VVPYYGAHPGTQIVFGATVAAWVVLETRQGLKRRPDAQMSDHGSHLIARAGVMGGWLVAVAATHVPGAAIGTEPLCFLIGLAAAWAGIALRLWSFRTLGRYFTFRVQTRVDQPVISSGPYRFVRHPGYTGLELALLGFALLLGTWIGVVAMAVLPMMGLWNRIRVEERALTAALGEPYRAFAATRKKMIPFVW